MRKTFITAVIACCASFAWGQQLPYQNPSLSPTERAEDLCSRLTLEEKALLMMDRSPAIPRLGIPQFEWWNETLHGVGRNGIATVFPITMGMAASFDDLLVYKVFTAASDEARAKNTEAKRNGEMARYRGLSFWTPNINIFRDPRWGRGQETYGEDPYLTTRMGLAVVNGLQGQDFEKGTSDGRYKKLFACAKHYAVHSGPEWNRHEFNVEKLPERDLWETYLPAFKALVQEGDVKEIMCAYQSIDGEPCCGNTRYLQSILRDEWGFKGIVTSDCGAIDDFFKPNRHNFVKTATEASSRAVIAGTDVECGSIYRSLPEAVKNGQITEAQIDVSLKRLLQGRFELGDFDPDELVEWTKIPLSTVASKEHKQLAVDVAQESIVLLKNNRILPLSTSSKIVVMGPNANDSTMLWGNYNGQPTHTTTILQGIRQYIPNARYIQGCTLTRNEVPASMFNNIFTPDGRQGFKTTFWNNEKMEGTPAAQLTTTEPVHLDNGGNTAFAAGVELEHFSARYEGVFRARQDGELHIDALNDDFLRIIFNGDTILDRTNGHGVRNSNLTCDVKAGRQYPVCIEYAQFTGHAMLQFDLTMKDDKSREDIMAEIKDANTVIFVGGISPRLEGEEMRVNEEGFKGGDRISIELPKVQRQWIADLKKMGKQVIFVNCSGSAIGLEPEHQNAEAIIQAWYGGEAGGKAVADVLFGKYNPCGKLPVTFYKNAGQLPDFLDYNMKGRTYRYFEGTPLYPFGYGLSYTTFTFGKPSFRDGKVKVSVKNTGSRDGSEVVQVYVRNPKDVEGPQKTLRGFKRISLKSGETKTVEIPMPRERFELWDPLTNTMRVVPGKYEVMVGNSSANSNLQKFMVNIK
ncbi:MAG: glycoside hydrolase family 3 C-terminal domain-containing protein [Prevotella sp.]|nr:glycoside hydrolase family 3 C-terminal domain-containing protein [Prevotella sp.]